jgi:hypothetical protein
MQWAADEIRDQTRENQPKMKYDRNGPKHRPNH